jgi:hypothetical protein
LSSSVARWVAAQEARIGQRLSSFAHAASARHTARQGALRVAELLLADDAFR